MTNRKMTRGVARTAGAAASVAALSLVAACGGSSLSEGGGGGEDAESVDIGLLVPRSGVYAPLGEDMDQGFRLCLDQRDGQLGGREVNVVNADEGESPDTGVPAAQGLIQDEVSAVVGVVSSAVALGVQDAFTEAEIPLVVANAGANDITGEGVSDYIWRTAYRIQNLSGSIGPHVAEEVGDGSVFLIAPDYAAGEEHVAAFKETFEEAGGTVAGEVFTPFGQTENFQPFLSQIRQSGASAVYAFYAGSEAVNFVRQYNAFGLREEVPLYAAGFVTEGGVLEALGADAEGIQNVLQYSPLLDTPENQEFVEAYEAAYDEPPTVYSAQAYDSCLALDQALEEGTTGPDIAAGLESIDTVQSPSGEWAFTENHQAEYTYYLRQVEMQEGEAVNAVLRPLNQE
ncbi:MAG: ABC transporter substrate-binding protein [Chloroflexota bacterium]|nr:ABC transporter substrate-binding protein [Chloroflexota bacterium]